MKGPLPTRRPRSCRNRFLQSWWLSGPQRVPSTPSQWMPSLQSSSRVQGSSYVVPLVSVPPEPRLPHRHGPFTSRFVCPAAQSDFSSQTAAKSADGARLARHRRREALARNIEDLLVL